MQQLNGVCPRCHREHVYRRSDAYQNAFRRGFICQRCSVSKYPDIKTRFFDGVKKTSSCWVWKKGKLSFGYGQMKIDGKPTGAHRVSWELHYGKIPEGMNVCHRCDNPPCVRPDHLFLGTDQDNMDDKTLKGRARYAKGEDNGISKLTEKEVSDIKSSPLSQIEIANIYKIHQSNVSRIRRGKTWGWV